MFFNFISTCHFCFIRKIIYHLKRNQPCFSLLKFCRSSIYVITIVKFSNSSFQTIFNFPDRMSMDFCKMIQFLELKKSVVSVVTILLRDFLVLKYVLKTAHILKRDRIDLICLTCMREKLEKTKQIRCYDQVLINF